MNWTKAALKSYEIHLLYFILMQLKEEMSQPLFILVLSTENNELV